LFVLFAGNRCSGFQKVGRRYRGFLAKESNAIVQQKGEKSKSADETALFDGIAAYGEGS